MMLIKIKKNNHLLNLLRKNSSASRPNTRGSVCIAVFFLLCFRSISLTSVLDHRLSYNVPLCISAPGKVHRRYSLSVQQASIPCWYTGEFSLHTGSPTNPHGEKHLPQLQTKQHFSQPAGIDFCLLSKPLSASILNSLICFLSDGFYYSSFPNLELLCIPTIHNKCFSRQGSLFILVSGLMGLLLAYYGHCFK